MSGTRERRSAHDPGRVLFKGLGVLAAPIASRDIKKRWEHSLENLKAATEGAP